MYSVLLKTLPYLAKGALNTLYMSIICLSLGLLIGIILGILSVIPIKIIKNFISAYVYIIRGIPLLILLFIVYYMLPFFGIELNAYLAAIICISVYISAFISEIIRGAILSLPMGQADASRSLGMRYFFYMRKIIIPQALRYAIPPIVNIALMCVKFTAVVSIISVWELTLAGKDVAETYGKPFQVYIEVALIYFVFCFALSRLGLYLEKRFQYEH